ncbi:MAG: gfo/Idh/MocA family oxidoreductase [Candidatus Lokiarchaeota archaeon]|nr:gfo/Idh/MocA family oxidoreductase [Candidatus Lokiarchaeota archaeon]MBD3338254.1 gfo/Idh/MocA family oxidoreductase [Candidatus Lokiarchaeota archaeon]
MKNVKVGIIGSGFIAEHHLYSYSLLPNVEVTGVSSVLAEEAKKLMKKFEIDGDPIINYADLLKTDCDAISVCVPNFLHKKITIDVLDSGKHALVEKPIARNVEEANQMLDAEKSSNRKILYCENNMYAPSFSKVKEIIEEGAVGQIYMGRGKEQHSGPHSAWFYNKEKSGGGALLDLGIHDIACLVWYLGCDVETVFCQTKTICPDRGDFGMCEVEDNAVGVLYFENNAQVVIEESWTAPGGYDMRFEIFGTEGQIKVAPTFSNLISVYSETGYGYAVEKASSTAGWTFPVPAESWTFGYPQEIQHFVDCIANDKKPLTDGEYSRKILNIIETMYKSAESGKIEEVQNF